MWQDYVLTLGGLVFAAVLIPQVIDCVKRGAVVNIHSASLTAGILFIFAATYGSLGMWLAAIPFAAVVWGIIAVYSYKNKKTRVCNLR